MTRRFFSEKTIHLAFEIALWLKAAFALTEIVGGIAAFFVSHQFLIHVASAITQGELREDPNDLLANLLLHATERLSIGTQHFVGIYLIAHGAVKLWLVIGLLRRRHWYYPVAIAVFDGFIAYQLYRFSITHSPWLMVVTVVDAIVIVLTWHEWRYLRRGV